MTTPQSAGQPAPTSPNPTVRGVHLPSAGGKKPSKPKKQPKPTKRGGKR